MTIISKNVDGAPFTIGQFITVVDSCDDTMDFTNVGLHGVIVHYEYDCGCGQKFPNDPMIGVRLEDGTCKEFWEEELEKFDTLGSIVINSEDLTSRLDKLESTDEVRKLIREEELSPRDCAEIREFMDDSDWISCDEQSGIVTLLQARCCSSH